MRAEGLHDSPSARTGRWPFCLLDCEVLDMRESAKHNNRTMAAWRSVSSGGIAVFIKVVLLRFSEPNYFPFFNGNTAIH